jgi:hypothetical protein
MRDRRTIIVTADVLLRRMDELTEDVIHGKRANSEVQDELHRLQAEWRLVVRELDHAKEFVA